jgi:hypothetical protein
MSSQVQGRKLRATHLVLRHQHVRRPARSYPLLVRASALP